MHLALETFRFDNEYNFDYVYNYLVEPNSWQSWVHKIIVRSNLVAILLFTLTIAEDLIVNNMNSKVKKFKL